MSRSIPLEPLAARHQLIGCPGLLLQAKSEQDWSFYEHLILEFKRSPTKSIQLLLQLKDTRRTSRPVHHPPVISLATAEHRW
jgi:hypothetical protein